MKRTIAACFVRSAGGILVMTALAKIISATGRDRVLDYGDPILMLSFRYVFLIIGTLELGIAILCFINKQTELSLKVLAWLSTIFLFYHFGLFWVGYKKPCSCMGSLTGALHMSSHFADIAVKVIVAYLLVGSYSMLLLNRPERAKSLQ